MSKQTEQKKYNLFQSAATLMYIGQSSSSNFFSTPNLKAATLEELLLYIQDPIYGQEAISLLCKRRDNQELGLMLWNSPYTASILVLELAHIHKVLEPGRLDIEESNSVCNTLALMQCMASHPEVKMEFIKAQLPLYLIPLLHSTCREKPFEYLRLTSLGIIGALVKVVDTNTSDIVHFLLGCEMLPLCLRCMEFGDELSKTVASFILSKILMQEEGVSYCCATANRFYAVASVMSSMLDAMGNIPSVRLLRHILQCYLSLSEMPRACDALKSCFPQRLRDYVFVNKIAEEPYMMTMFERLCCNVNIITGESAKPKPIGPHRK